MMNIQKIQPGQKMLIVRYGVNIEENCIELHKRIVLSKGYCWFGKIGIVPSKSSYLPVLGEDNPFMILYNRRAAYLCDFLDICFDKPDDGYPSYYQNAFFDRYEFPGCYFKLGSITEIDIERLSEFYVVSSGNDALTTLNSARTSFLFVSYGKLSDEEVEKIRIKKANMQKDNRPVLSVNDCYYKKEGICTLKSCISYQYECERPSSCAKQRR